MRPPASTWAKNSWADSRASSSVPCHRRNVSKTGRQYASHSSDKAARASGVVPRARATSDQRVGAKPAMGHRGVVMGGCSEDVQ